MRSNHIVRKTQVFIKEGNNFCKSHFPLKILHLPSLLFWRWGWGRGWLGCSGSGEEPLERTQVVELSNKSRRHSSFQLGHEYHCLLNLLMKVCCSAIRLNSVRRVSMLYKRCTFLKWRVSLISLKILMSEIHSFYPSSLGYLDKLACFAFLALESSNYLKPLCPLASVRDS